MQWQTGSFGSEIIKYIKDTYFTGGKAAFYENYIQEENGLLSRLIAFEIMMTSYVVAHLKMRRTIDARDFDEIVTKHRSCYELVYDGANAQNFVADGEIEARRERG